MTKAGKRKESLDNRIFNSIVNLLLILFGLLAGLWVVTDLIFTWAMSRA